MVYKTTARPISKPLEKHLKLGGKNQREEIQVNSRYFLKDREPWIPIMGEMHYPRVPREQWRETLARMKAGGITVVSSYVIWIYHQEREELFNFEGNQNLREFIQTAKDCGLYVMLRIGPWVHGEVRNGGFPDWLIRKGFPLRCNHPDYLRCVRRFFREIAKQAKGLLFQDNGPVFGIQLENELTEDAAHLLKLKELAMEEGLRVPIYTVTGWNAKNGAKIPEDDVIPVFGGYVEAPWEQHMEKLEPSSHWFFLPDRNDSCIGADLLPHSEGPADQGIQYERYPFATCELGGGVQPTYHRRPVIGEEDAAASAMLALGCGNNLPGYYMYRGGVNQILGITLQESKATGYPNDYPILNYDFQAPLGSWGQTHSAYRKLKLQHLFLQCFQKMFAPMETRFQEHPILDRRDKKSLRYCVRTDGAKGFVFVNLYQRLDQLEEKKSVRFEVPVREGTMVFPEKGMRIPSGTYCFLPYRIPMGEETLLYATAQLLWKEDDTWFFFAAPGIETEYCMENPKGKKSFYKVQAGKHILHLPGCRIVTLTQEEAENFYAIDGKIFLTEGAEMYREGDKLTVRREEKPDLSFFRWNGEEFIYESLLLEQRTKEIAVYPVKAEQPESPWKEELFLGGNTEIRGWSLEPAEQKEEVDTEAYLEISYTGDVLQVYADGELVDDEFYRGVPFLTRDFLGEKKKIQVWISRLKPGSCYLEQGQREGLCLEQVRWIPIYKKSWNFTQRTAKPNL